MFKSKILVFSHSGNASQHIGY